MKNWKLIPFFVCLTLFLSATAFASGTVSVTLTLPDGTPSERTVSCPDGASLWYASYAASGAMLEAGRASVQDGKAAVTVPEGAEKVKLFALDDNFIPQAAATEIHLNAEGGEEADYSAYYTENLVRWDEMTVCGVPFHAQTLSGMRQNYFETYSNGYVQGIAAEDGYLYEFDHVLWQDAEQSAFRDYNLPPTEIRGIELGGKMENVLNALGLTEYAVNEFMSHKGSDNDSIVAIFIKSGRITDIRYEKMNNVEDFPYDSDFLQVCFEFRDVNYEFSFGEHHGIVDDMFYLDIEKFWRVQGNEGKTDYGAYYTENLVRMDEMTVDGALFTEQTVSGLKALFGGHSSVGSYEEKYPVEYWALDSWSEAGYVSAEEADGRLYRFEQFFYEPLTETPGIPAVRAIQLGQPMRDVLKTLGLSEYAVNRITPYRGRVTCSIESGEITDIRCGEFYDEAFSVEIVFDFRDVEYELSVSSSHDGVLSAISYLDAQKLHSMDSQ